MIDISTIDAKVETPKLLGIKKAQIDLMLGEVIPTTSEKQLMETVDHEITRKKGSRIWTTTKNELSIGLRIYNTMDADRLRFITIS